MSLLSVFRNKKKLEADFNSTFSNKLRPTDRVQRRKDGALGTVVGTGVVDGSLRVPALTVQHDDGSMAFLVPAEEYTRPQKYQRVVPQ
jgi:hypothetical protein